MENCKISLILQEYSQWKKMLRGCKRVTTWRYSASAETRAHGLTLDPDNKDSPELHFKIFCIIIINLYNKHYYMTESLDYPKLMVSIENSQTRSSDFKHSVT